MKQVVFSLKFACTVIFCGVLMVTCSKPETVPADPPDPPGNPTDSNAENISDHLQFFFPLKKTGTIPAGPAGSSLKISFEDTLYLMDEIKTPIKFFHQDASENVAGIYLQVHGGASYYYDVPEIPEMADSDTVSVIMIGIDPAGFIDLAGVPPAGGPVFEITITPYGENGEPIAEDTRPVKIVQQNTDPNGNGGSCGLVLPEGEHWRWDLSVVMEEHPTKEKTFAFYNEPYKVYGAGGQDIKGSCCDGSSVYGICPGDSIPNASLHFATHYQIQFETFKFFDDGTFFRQTMESTPLPAPDESDFCAGGEGVTIKNLNHTLYNGNWDITPFTLPPDLDNYYSDSLYLGLQGTSSTGFGYGNPGGSIHQLDCNIGALVLIQFAAEGGTGHLYKFYSRASDLRDEPWYPFVN